MDKDKVQYEIMYSEDYMAWFVGAVDNCIMTVKQVFKTIEEAENYVTLPSNIE